MRDEARNLAKAKLVGTLQTLSEETIPELQFHAPENEL